MVYVLSFHWYWLQAVALNVCLRVVDGQMQGDSAVAALRCLEQLHIVATRGVRAVVPLVLAASRRTELGSFAF